MESSWVSCPEGSTYTYTYVYIYITAYPGRGSTVDVPTPPLERWNPPGSVQRIWDEGVSYQLPLALYTSPRASVSTSFFESGQVL